jgi:uncharacterized protein (TIGR02145 family)
MKCFNLTAKLGRTLMLAAAVAVAAVCWLGCAGKDNGGNPATGGGGDLDAVPTPTHPSSDEDYNIDVDADSIVRGQPDSGDSEIDRAVDPFEMVTIGGKKWQKYNMNVGEFSIPSWVNFGYLVSGRLYTWQGAKDICENYGMRLPTVDDWRALIKAAGGSMAGYNLKSYTRRGSCAFGICSDQGLWHTEWPFWDNDPVTYSIDAYGFSAVPVGYYERGEFYAERYYAYFWAANESGDEYAYYYHMGWNYNDVKEKIWKKSMGYSVRCVRD